MGSVAVSSDDVARLQLPADIRNALLSTRLPAVFHHFDVACDATSFRVEERDSAQFLVLGSTDAGSVAVDLSDGSVWWLQNAIHHPPELRSRAYRQFINSDIAAYARSVAGCEDLLREIGPAADRLRALIAEVDPPALDDGRHGVWRDVVLDWEAGL